MSDFVIGAIAGFYLGAGSIGLAFLFALLKHER